MRVKVGSMYYHDMVDFELPIYECLWYIQLLKLLSIEKLMLTTVLNSSSSEVSTTCSHTFARGVECGYCCSSMSDFAYE